MGSAGGYLSNPARRQGRYGLSDGGQNKTVASSVGVGIRNMKGNQLGGSVNFFRCFCRCLLPKGVALA